MAITLDALLQGHLGSTLHPRIVPAAPREIRQVTLLEDLGMDEALRPGAIVVLSRASEVSAGGYQLDILVRRAAERGVAALVLRRATRRSLTAENLALRGELALLDVADDADPSQVLESLGAAVSGDARAALSRLARAAAYEPGDGLDEETMLREISRLAGLEVLKDETATSGALVDVDGRPSGAVVSPELGDAARVATALAASTLSRVLTAEERATLRPVRSTSSALSQLLLCSQANLATVSERALDTGLEVHGWHCAVRLSVDGSSSGFDAPIEDELVSLVARFGRDGRASWTVARPDDSLVLVRTTRSDPGRGSDERVRGTVDDLLAALVSRRPAHRFRVGIATPHEGVLGLRASAEEARIALASAWLSDDPVSVATFDALGLRRMLAEWLVTGTARDTVSDLLAPLDALGPEKGGIAVETLHAYLDERGSLQRAAARLNLHRNAVVYRMAQITETLPNDLGDPDERFALQLACRARLMALGRA